MKTNHESRSGKNELRPAGGLKFFCVICFIALIVSFLPVLYCSLFDYATGDDFGYSAALHQVIKNHEGIGAALSVITAQVRSSYALFQGTWSSIVLFQLQPGIFGERVYTITVWIALFCILAGTAYMLYPLLVRRWTVRPALFWTVYALCMIIMIQFMPKERGGLFWYTSIAHYIIPYLAASVSIGAAERFLERGKKRHAVYMILLMSYLGGAGYPLIVFAGLVIFLLMLCTLIYPGKEKGRRKRALFFLLPLLLLAAGFIISAKAPGNKVRGGEDFGFSAERVLSTVLSGFEAGLAETAGYLQSCRLLIVFLFVTFVLVFAFYEEGRQKHHGRILLTALLGYLTVSAVRMPRIYAAVEVSGGLTDVEYFVSILWLFLLVTAIAARCKEAVINKSAEGARRRAAVVISLLCFAFVVIEAKHFVGGSVDYVCLDFIQSGGLADFNDQMQERLAILEDDSIKDAVVPQMNSEQGPFMHMALLEDPDSFTNDAEARYYGKNSVTAVDRETFEAWKEQRK